MGMNKQIVLDEADYSAYKDASDCFGNDKSGYDITTPECLACKKENGEDFTNKCKALCGGIEGIKEEEFEEGPSSVSASAEPVKEDTPLSDKSVRDQILDAVEAALGGITYEITNTATRHKVFIGTDDVFVVTDRGLKVNRLESGKDFGPDYAKDWEADNKGIIFAWNTDLDFEEIARKAYAILYNKSAPVTPPEEVIAKADLFVTVVKEDKPEKPEKPEKPAIQLPVPTSTDNFVSDDMYKGEVVKSLQIIKYSNDYTEVRITVKSSEATALLSRIKGDFA